MADYDYDDLFVRKTGSRDWVSNLTAEQREWFDGLVNRCKERRALPVGDEAAKKYHELFGSTVARDTLLKHLRRLTGLDK